MKPLVNHLVQLQELVMIREEQRVAGREKHLKGLNESIAEMMEKLPAPVSLQFNKLLKRDANVVVPMSDSGCSVCGMKLPRSQVQAVKLEEEIQYCPTCARILFTDPEAARNVQRKQKRYEARKSGIARFSDEALMIPKLEAKNCEEAIRELAQLMAENGYIDRGERLVEEALSRESVLSTAVDHGLAFPHVRGVEGGGLTLAMGLSKKGIRFDEGRRELTRIVFFMVIPTAASAFYLKLLAGLTESFMDDARRDELLACKDAASMWKCVVKATRRTVK
jgi:mannitol/fructose-specific phosphotransferase system IIA component (Ntr-type)